MKKICFCTTISPTLECFFVEASRYLHEHEQWDISFICAHDEAFAKSLPEFIHYYPLDMKRGVTFDGLRVTREMKRIFVREQFDVVQYSTPNASLYASIASRSAKIPVRNYHLMGFRYMGASGAGRELLKKIEKTTCRNSTHIECVSPSVMKTGIAEGMFPAAKAAVVWNGSTGGVNLNRFDSGKREQWRREIRRELGLAEDDFVYGFVGRITRDKGLNELLEAYFSMEHSAKLLIVGDSEGESTLNPALWSRAKKSSGVVICRNAADIERYYAAMDVLVLPSYREGFGNVIIESAAVGTPAIVTDIPGPVDAVSPGRTALLTEPKNAAALAKTMNDIRRMDYKKMGQAAAAYAEQCFDSKKLNEKIAERKRELLSAARGK